MMDTIGEMFGAGGRQELWQHIASGIGDEFLDGEEWKGNRVAVKQGNWTLTLDTDRLDYGEAGAVSTRLRAPYINADGFRFQISPEGLMGRIGKLFGLQDVQTGDAEFDTAFLVRSTDEAKVKAFLENSSIRDGLLALGPAILSVKDDDGIFGEDFPDGVDELYLEVPAAFATAEKLKGLVDFFAECLHQLCRIGSASPADPGLEVG